ncbi:uncharacterized protein K02A2.6-like [Eupeodes corollae]|uniref:uncharacterized protein K02A2.6-like n=1 Tax=Eupeodes corollae TaxID=290404 RepID=UPI002491D380|nr:uncharacterized protein K02A2.6-like [Eupeodes corollae]
MKEILSPVKFSKWASPLVVVVKKNGDIRLCADFKVSLNKVTDMEHYPIPNVDDMLASLEGGSVFCVLDLTGAFQQLKIAPESQEFCTVNTHLGLMRYNRLTYGLKSAPCIFQKTMDEILRGTNALCYIDDVFVKGKSFEDCAENLEHYLGHVITSFGIKPSPGKIEAIQKAPIPKNVTQVKSYLGLLNYYRKFVPMQSSLLAPLYKLTCSGTTFVLESSCQDAFNKSKEALSKETLLQHYNSSQPLILSCDASKEGVGAVVSQIKENKECPVVFASATLNSAEKNYSQVEKEALAIIFGVRKFYKYLVGKKFTLFTDHQPLKVIFDVRKGVTVTAASRLQRWALLLSAFDYEIKYKKGREMSGPDAMSRLPLKKSRTHEMTEHLINVFKEDEYVPISYEDIAHHTRKDAVLCKVIELVQNGWPDHIQDDVSKPFFTRKYSLSIEQVCILYGIRVLVPTSLRSDVLQLLHQEHPGIVKMKLLARSICWWPKIDQDIEEICAGCVPCQQIRGDNTLEKSFLGWPKLEKPWIRLHIDFFSFSGKTFLLSVDATSKWMDVFYMTSTTADAMILKLRQLFSTFGLPEQLVSDNGPPFTSDRFIRFLKSKGVDVMKSPPYFPQANVLAERFVQVVKKFFKKKFIEGKQYSQYEIESNVSEFLFSYRNSPSPSTRMCPANYMFKNSPRTVLRQIQPTFGQNSNPAAKNLNRTDKKFIYAVGEKIWLRILKTWDKATVLQCISGNRYLVKHENNVRIAHQHQMRPCLENQLTNHQPQPQRIRHVILSQYLKKN